MPKLNFLIRTKETKRKAEILKPNFVWKKVQHDKNAEPR